MDRAQRYYTVAEVAARFGVSVDTVRKWIKAGELEAIMLGPRKAGYRIADGAIDAFVARRTTRSAIGKALLASAT